MIVTIRELDRDRRTCRAHDTQGAKRVITFARACERSLACSLVDGCEVDVEIAAGEIVRADVVIGRVRP